MNPLIVLTIQKAEYLFLNCWGRSQKNTDIKSFVHITLPIRPFHPKDAIFI